MAFRFLLLSALLLMAVSAAFAVVPANETFRYVNDGILRDLSNEYDATYRTTQIGAHPFQLMFYNTTPDAFILAYRMGSVGSESSRFWVWEANRDRPVRDGATLTLGPNGDLVLAEPDGTVAWHSGTANRGVVALKTLSNGNLMLVDAAGKAVWQSFDHVTDTLLVGQSLPVGGALVSRVSVQKDSDGPYSLKVTANGLNFLIGEGSNSVLYGRMPLPSPKPLSKVTFSCSGRTLRLLTDAGPINLATAKKSCSLSFLRLGIDGDLVVNTFDDNAVGNAWAQSYSFFTGAKSCDLPTRCGPLGVCQSGKCVSCPAPQGPVPWTDSCAAPTRLSCSANQSYYKVVGVEHVLTKFTGVQKGLTAEECKRRCNANCNCLGFFYWEEVGKCWLAPELGTLRKVATTSHVAYIIKST